MFSTTLSPLPDMVAHASSADAPFDSEVSTADLDSEAFATTPSAPTPSSPSSSAEAIQLDLLSQLMDTDSTTTTASTPDNSAASTSTSTLLSDHSIIAMASTSSSSTWAHSPSISPMVLKLESPVMATLPAPTSKSKATSSSTSGAVSGSRKRPSTAEPMDKEAKARERVLRNRAAAQESRDKKRKYVSEIEASNESLQQENCQLLKRLKTVESDNLALSQRLETLTAQFAQMQQLLTQSLKQNQPGAGFCQSAAEAGSTGEPSHYNLNASAPSAQHQTPTSLFDDDEDLDEQVDESEQGSPLVGSECSSNQDGDQLSAFLQQQSLSQPGLDALLLCSSLFSTSANLSATGGDFSVVHDALFEHHPASADAELFDSFLDLDWSTIEQSAAASSTTASPSGAAVAAGSSLFYPTALLESSV